MKMIWISVGVVAAGLMSFTACGNGTSSTGTGGTPGTGGATGGSPGTGGTPGTGGSPGISCMECACTKLLSEGGCADKCDDMKNGNPNTPNFCNSASALPQCAACIASACNEPDPTKCM